MAYTCDTCCGTHFHTVDGFYYCLECGTQSQQQQVEMESEAVKIGDRTIGGEVIHLQKASQDNPRITSWEEYNYILVGLVDEVISLGANYRVKKVVLKLWARYLQTTEAAFFSLHDECLPRLPANYQKRDAEILYNRNHKKRRRRRSSCSSADTAESKTSTGKAESVIKSFKISKILKKTKEELARAQYEDYKKLQDDSSSLASSLATSSQHSADTKGSSVSLKLQLTRNARRVLKRNMTKTHLEKHASDYEDDLDCHQERVLLKSSDKTETLSKSVLFAIIYVALNLTEDDIQLGDLIRFLREGHISYYNIQHFLPENIRLDEPLDFENLKRLSIFDHDAMRVFTVKLCRDMAIPQLIRPNILRLIDRYIDELCLPEELKVILERFVKFRPPVMELKADTKILMIPNYEGRAMAYIIFVLKLLFGMDDEREVKISESARQINRLIPSESSLHLFVVGDWLQMLKVRRTILEKVHMPSALVRKWDEVRGKASAQMYSDHIKSVYERKIPSERQKRSYTNANAVANNTFQYLSGLNERIKDGEDDSSDRDPRSYSFNASIFPLRDYMKEMLTDKALNTTTELCLRQDFNLKSVQVFYGDKTKLDQLNEALMVNCSLQVQVEELGLATRKLRLLDERRHLMEKKPEASHSIKVEFVTAKTLMKLSAGRNDMPEHANEEAGHRLRHAQEAPGLKIESGNIPLTTSNMDYWMYFASNYLERAIHPASAYQELLEHVPRNFKFLLFECCRIVEQSPQALLLQLAIVERNLIYNGEEKTCTGPSIADRLW